MPHEGNFSGSPADWLRYARSDLEPVNEEEYKETVRLAETIVLWAEKIIQKQKDDVT